MQKIHQICLLSLVAIVTSLIASSNALSQPLSAKTVMPKKSQLSLIPSIFYATQSGQLSYGAEVKFSISSEISARPFAAFSGNSNLSGIALTYDFPVTTKTTPGYTPPGGVNDRLDQLNSSETSISTSAWFLGAGGLVKNVAGVSSGVKPFLLVGGNTGLAKVDVKYVFDTSEFIGSAGINLNF